MSKFFQGTKVGVVAEVGVVTFEPPEFPDVITLVGLELEVIFGVPPFCGICLLLIKFLYSVIRTFLPSTIQVLFGRGLKFAKIFCSYRWSLEVDVKCTLCKGSGCRVCKHSGWLEVCGAGMIHPEVLKLGGVDPEVYSGFAWGGGVDRLFLLLHGVPDIRLFLENDMRFLEQFP